MFPTPARPAYLFARLSSGSLANAIQIDEVIGNASTPTQSLTKLGEARGPASGDWNRFNCVSVRDDIGNLVLFEWSGTKTLRVTPLPGGNEDMDYFVFNPAASSGPAQLVEVMSQDLGGSGAGFAGNFAIASLRVAADSEVRLVDLEDNASGAGSEALYVDAITVSPGGILDLLSANPSAGTSHPCRRASPWIRFWGWLLRPMNCTNCRRPRRRPRT